MTSSCFCFSFTCRKIIKNNSTENVSHLPFLITAFRLVLVIVFKDHIWISLVAETMLKSVQFVRIRLNFLQICFPFYFVLVVLCGSCMV